MSDFDPRSPFKASDFPAAGTKEFPIVEVFGHDRHLPTDSARDAFRRRWCPFSDTRCEKFDQYGYGYCSVTYRTAFTTAAQTYAVCDHRLDGAPIDTAIQDYFGDTEVDLIPEVVVTDPRMSFDFVAIDENDDFIGIEAQAIDLRGGGVGPAWASVLEGDPSGWRARFTAEAKLKMRGDTVAYGVNTANIYKRLGLQVAEKGALLRKWGAKLYVVAQEAPFAYLRNRVAVDWTVPKDKADISIITFDYTGKVDRNGQHEFGYFETYRTTVAAYSAALAAPTTTLSRSDFVMRVRKKGASR